VCNDNREFLRSRCSTCGLQGHAKKSSHKCRYNSKHPDYIYKASSIDNNNQTIDNVVQTVYANNNKCNNSYALNKKGCRSCGRIGHSKKSSRDCLLNPANMNKNIANDNNINIVNNTNLAEDEIVYSVLDDLSENNKCICGATDHESAGSQLCSLHPNNTGNHISSEKIAKCKCGSTLHQRITHRFCPMNKRFTHNTLANTIQTQDDINEIYQSNVQINTHLFNTK
jgi:hypothetical protein